MSGTRTPGPYSRLARAAREGNLSEGIRLDAEEEEEEEGKEDPEAVLKAILEGAYS